MGPSVEEWNDPFTDTSSLLLFFYVLGILKFFVGQQVFLTFDQEECFNASYSLFQCACVWVNA